MELTRPLLDRSKGELLRFAQARGIIFREDATNASLDMQRNRIRKELLPLLRANYQTAIDKTIGRAVEILTDEADVLSELAEMWLKDSRARLTRRRKSMLPKVGGWLQMFETMPVGLQRRCIRLQLVKMGIAPEFELVEFLRRSTGERIMVGKEGLPVSVSRDTCGLLKTHRAKVERRGFKSGCATATLKERGSVLFGDLEVSWVIGPAKRRRDWKARNYEVFDADLVGEAVCLRHWQAGDRFQPIGMRNRVKLQDFFTNEKVPAEERRRLVLGTTSSGEIFWVEKMRISDRFKLTERTIRCLHWYWKRP
jgi:tRNA(Ile)-lysidine synthase